MPKIVGAVRMDLRFSKREQMGWLVWKEDIYDWARKCDEDFDWSDCSMRNNLDSYSGIGIDVDYKQGYKICDSVEEMIEEVREFTIGYDVYAKGNYLEDRLLNYPGVIKTSDFRRTEKLIEVGELNHFGLERYKGNHLPLDEVNFFMDQVEKIKYDECMRAFRYSLNKLRNGL